MKDRIIWKYPISSSFCTYGNKVDQLPGNSCSNATGHVVFTSDSSEGEE